MICQPVMYISDGGIIFHVWHSNQYLYGGLSSPGGLWIGPLNVRLFSTGNHMMVGEE